MSQRHPALVKYTKLHCLMTLRLSELRVLWSFNSLGKPSQVMIANTIIDALHRHQQLT